MNVEASTCVSGWGTRCSRVSTGVRSGEHWLIRSQRSCVIRDCREMAQQTPPERPTREFQEDGESPVSVHVALIQCQECGNLTTVEA